MRRPPPMAWCLGTWFAALAFVPPVPAWGGPVRGARPPAATSARGEAPATPTAHEEAGSDTAQVLHEAIRRYHRPGSARSGFVMFTLSDEAIEEITAEAGGLTKDEQTRECYLSSYLGASNQGDKQQSAAQTRSCQVAVPLHPSTRTLRHATRRLLEMAAHTLKIERAVADVRDLEQPQKDDQPRVFAVHEPVHRTDSEAGNSNTPLSALIPAVMRSELRTASRAFDQVPDLLEGKVSLRATQNHRLLVNSEGSEIKDTQTLYGLLIETSALAKDGEQLQRSRAYYFRRAAEIPQGGALQALVGKAASELMALQQAPKIEPYTGPALLSGGAAAIFFHEILGHRVEGQRRDQGDGQTLTPGDGKQLLPSFLDIEDDPTLREFQGTPLNGSYEVDDEGIPAERVRLVEQGQLKGLLESRVPSAGVTRSNGHGRGQAHGPRICARQGNLIVHSSAQTSAAQLRARLLDLCRKANLPYGLYFEDVVSGFTNTSRATVQAFSMEPTLVYRIWVDGRPDELVRGVNLIGTPLASLSGVVACGGQSTVLNGFCGAESGMVPVAAIAPAMLTRQIETERQAPRTSPPWILDRLPGLPTHATTSKKLVRP